MVVSKKPLHVRFEQSILRLPIAACWLWTGDINNYGYARLLHNGRNYAGHRLAWNLYKGEIPHLMCVLHKCDVRLCVNPHHLFIGNEADNMRDCINKGRKPMGSKHATAKLTEEQIASIVIDDRAQRLIANQYGVSQSLVSMIKSGLRWKHVTPRAHK
jgi:hypothetical protein